MDVLTDSEIDQIVSKSKLASKYNHLVDSQSAYEILHAKLEEAALKTEKEYEEQEKPAAKEESFFDNPIVRNAGRTAATIITRSLLGALGLGGRSRKKNIW